MNRDQTVYVRSVFSEGHPLTYAVSQGADADDFNPDRFIDADGEVTPALADTKDGASCFDKIHPFLDSPASRLQKVIVPPFHVLSRSLTVSYHHLCTGHVSFVSRHQRLFSSCCINNFRLRASDRGMNVLDASNSQPD